MTSSSPTAWLQQLLGEWTYVFRTADDSDHPGATATGVENVRSISGAFVAIEIQPTPTRAEHRLVP